MAQKPVLRGEVGCACVAREVSVERGGMGERVFRFERPYQRMAIFSFNATNGRLVLCGALIK